MIGLRNLKAIDPFGNVVGVSDAIKNVIYRCPRCNEILIYNNGDNNMAFFSHKNSINNKLNNCPGYSFSDVKKTHTNYVGIISDSVTVKLVLKESSVGRYELFLYTSSKFNSLPLNGDKISLLYSNGDVHRIKSANINYHKFLFCDVDVLIGFNSERGLKRYKELARRVSGVTKLDVDHNIFIKKNDMLVRYTGKFWNTFDEYFVLNRGGFNLDIIYKRVGGCSLHENGQVSHFLDYDIFLIDTSFVYDDLVIFMEDRGLLVDVSEVVIDEVSEVDCVEIDEVSEVDCVEIDDVSEAEIVDEIVPDDVGLDLNVFDETIDSRNVVCLSSEFRLTTSDDINFLKMSGVNNYEINSWIYNGLIPINAIDYIKYLKEMSDEG